MMNKRVLKKILILTSLTVLLVSGKKAQARECMHYSDRWGRYLSEYEQVAGKIRNLEEDLRAINKNPYLTKKLKPVMEKIRQEIRSFDRGISDKNQTEQKFKKIYLQAAPLMNAYRKGKHVIWMNLLAICEANDLVQEINPKLDQYRSAGNAKQQAKYDDYFQKINSEVEVLKAGECPSYIDPSLIPPEGIKFPLWSTALTKKQEMDQVIFKRGILPRGQKINYDFLDDRLSQKACKWLEDLPEYGGTRPVREFWYDDDNYQTKRGDDPKLIKKPEFEDPAEVEKAKQVREQVRTFFYRLAEYKGNIHPGCSRFDHSFQVFSDRLKDEYLQMKQRALEIGKPMTDLTIYEEEIACTDPLILFDNYHYSGDSALDRISRALKRIKIGELAQQTLRIKITPLAKSMDKILQIQEPAIKEDFRKFKAIADELEERKASLKQQLTDGVLKKTNLLGQIDSTLKQSKNIKRGQKKTLSDLIPEEMMERNQFQQKRAEIKQEDQEQQVLMGQNQGLQKQKNELLQKIKDVKLQLEQNDQNLARSKKRIEIFHKILPTLVVGEEKNEEELQKLQGQLTTSLQQQRQEEEAGIINNEAVKVANEEVVRQQEQIKQCQVELEKTKFRSGIFPDQEVIALASRLQELQSQIQKNQADADHLQQHQQEYLDFSQQLMSILAEIQHQKELQGELDQAIEQLAREFGVRRQRNLKLAQSLQKFQAKIQSRQQTIDLLSGIDHCSDLTVLPVFCYSRVQNIRDETIRFMVRGTLALGLDHVDLDCHGLTTKDIEDYVARVIKIIGEIDFSAVPEKTWQINFITGHGRHSVIAEFSVIKERLIEVLASLEIKILPSNHRERGRVKAVFDQRFLCDNPQGFKIRKINYKKLRKN